MNTLSPSEEYGHLRLYAERIATPDSWHAFLLPLESVPLDTHDRPALRSALDKLLNHVAHDQVQAERSLWLLLDQLHKDGAVRLIAKNGTIWNPDMGIGLWPDREPPRMWTRDELLERDYLTPIRELKHTVVHINADKAGFQHAWETMLGTGGVIELLHTGEVAKTIEHWQDVLQPTIEDEAFQAYPFTFPLIEKKSIERRSKEQLDSWFGPVSFYLRESAEDTGILLLSRTPLEKALEKAGIRYPPALEP